MNCLSKCIAELLLLDESEVLDLSPEVVGDGKQTETLASWLEEKGMVLVAFDLDTPTNINAHPTGPCILGVTFTSRKDESKADHHTVLGRGIRLENNRIMYEMVHDPQNDLKEMLKTHTTHIRHVFFVVRNVGGEHWR